VWRLLREFERRALPLTVFGVAMALQRHPEVAQAFVQLGHEIACHGWRWIAYQDVDEATEREHLQRAMQAIEQLTGARPLGWYTGRDSPRTRRLVADHGGFEYDSDAVKRATKEIARTLWTCLFPRHVGGFRHANPAFVPGARRTCP
jgi:peptidoglycan/xylan/chitin deacetylase (PgdA/CDA1 family)